MTQIFTDSIRANPPNPRHPRSILQGAHLLAALMLALFVLLLFGRLLFTNRVLASGDILHYFYPYREYAAAALRAGELPLWNPYIFAGVPFLANPQAGVLYPLHWPLSWLTVTAQLYWSAALHAWLLALGGYALLRRWGLGWTAGVIGGLVLAGSGFYGGMLGHINQMNAAAWLPWMAWAVLSPRRLGPAQWQTLSRRVAWLGLFVALSLLAGHTQTVYINLFGVGVLLVGLGLREWQRRGRDALGSLAADLLVYAAGVALGGLLAAAQLLPTLELSGLGLRSGGLSYQETTSFSLRPLLLGWTLLPSYGLRDLSVVFGTLGYTEFVAGVGTLGLLLAGWGLWRGERKSLWWMGIAFAGLGLFLALGRWNPAYYLLYKLVPGFDLFRTPARWLMLYTLGIAILAAVGAERLSSWLRPQADIDNNENSPQMAQIFADFYPFQSVRSASSAFYFSGRFLALLLLAADLLLSALALPHTHPTAPQAVYDVRTAPAHLLTDPARGLHPAAMGRFLGMSTITFDPGDMADWRRILLESQPFQIDGAAFREFVIALKSQEILAPNLPLLWRIPAADGFDGGVLPLERYNRFLALFVPPDQLVPDGRLREQVKRIPAADVLDRMDIRYVITDKVEDLWFQGVYYDRQIGARLQPGGDERMRVAVDRPFRATEVRVIGTLDGPDAALARLADRPRPLVAVRAGAGDEQIALPHITGGGGPDTHFSSSALDSPLAQASGAVVAYRDVDGRRQEYLARLPLPAPAVLDELHLALLPDAPPDVTVTIQAVTLYDGPTSAFVPLLPSDRGAFRLVHSGDVKVYERLNPPGRVSLAYRLRPATSPENAVGQLLAAQPGEVVVEASAAQVAGWAIAPDGAGRADFTSYAPERIVVETQSDGPGLLVLRDSFYPGWQATVDGDPAPIYPVDVLFRGVVVPGGSHEIVFRYAPPQWPRGLFLSGGGLLVWLLLWAWPGLLLWYNAGRTTGKPAE